MDVAPGPGQCPYLGPCTGEPRSVGSLLTELEAKVARLTAERDAALPLAAKIEKLQADYARLKRDRDELLERLDPS